MPTNAHKGGETIEDWMLAIVSDGGVVRFDHLHIDQIDPAWKSRDQWIEGGLEAFRMAVGVRNRNQLPFVVALGFSLESSDQSRGGDFRTKQALFAALDWSPPSLYLFRRGEEPDTQVPSSEGSVQHLDPSTLGAEGDVRCYYLEFKHPCAIEYCRSIFIEG